MWNEIYSGFFGNAGTPCYEWGIKCFAVGRCWLLQGKAFTQCKECSKRYIKLLAPDLNGVVRGKGVGKRIRGPTDVGIISLSRHTL